MINVQCVPSLELCVVTNQQLSLPHYGPSKEILGISIKPQLRNLTSHVPQHLPNSVRSDHVTPEGTWFIGRHEGEQWTIMSQHTHTFSKVPIES